MTIGLLWLLWLILHGLITTRFGLDAILMLHLKNELAIFNISVLWHEGSLAFTIAMSGVSPSVFVQMIAFEVLFPTQLELVFTILIAQPVVDLKVFESGVPGHVCIRFKNIFGQFGRKEIQNDAPFLIQEIIFSVNFTSSFDIVDDESDMLRCPPDIILMPVVGWVKVLNQLRSASAARNIFTNLDFVTFMRSKLYKYLVKAFLAAPPLGKESRLGATFVRALHPCHEATIMEIVP